MTFLQAEMLLFHKRKEGQTDFAVIFQPMKMTFSGNAFSQNSAVRNEQGMYIGMQWTPFARWKLSAYADVFRFPWLKYGVDAPSTGK